jgi:ribosomal protein S18 acetylase RimI-like enzyme
VAEGEDEAVYGIAFLAVRDVATFDVYAAVHPSLRRQGLGRALCEAALALPARLRARVREEAAPGLVFLRKLGFRQTGAQLSLQWRGGAPSTLKMPALRIRPGLPKDRGTVERLSREAWEADALAARPDEIAQLFGQDRALWLAESQGKPLGYLAGVLLGRTLGIEELAVLPEARRMGVAKTLLSRALEKAQGAVLSVAESNTAARALYRSAGFTVASRRLLFERTYSNP